MKTINLIRKTEKDGHLRFDIPTGVVNGTVGTVEVVVVINELESNSGTGYDFKDLSGRLHWEGNSLVAIPGKRYLLDTNAVVALLKGNRDLIRGLVAELNVLGFSLKSDEPAPSNQ